MTTDYQHQWRKHWQAATIPNDTDDRIDMLVNYRRQYQHWLAYHLEAGNTLHVADLRANLFDINRALIDALKQEAG